MTTLTKQSILLGTYGEMVDLKRVLMYFDSAMIPNYSKWKQSVLY